MDQSTQNVENLVTSPSDSGAQRPPHPGSVWDEDDRTLVDLDPWRTWEIDLERAERIGDTERVERLRTLGPPPGMGPSQNAFAPLVFAVDVAGDPGGAIAVALAATQFRNLALVVAMGGDDGARYARYLLDLTGRADVAVVRSAAPSTMDVPAELIHPQVPRQSDDVEAAVRSVTELTPYLLLWANHGALTDLARTLADDPALPDRLSVSIDAGPLDATQPQFASDPASAAQAITLIRRPKAELHDPRSANGPSSTPELLTAPPHEVDIGPGATLHQLLAAPGSPRWAHLLGHHLNEWFAAGHPESSQIASLVIANVMQRPFIQSKRRGVVVDQTGRVGIDAAGKIMDVTVTTTRFDVVFTDWLAATLRQAMPPS